MNQNDQATFNKLSLADQKAEILDWFNSNYVDPVECLPFESAEGGYQYIWGGPYEAFEVIDGRFGGIASVDLIAEVADELNEICVEWSCRPESD
jgi:hypothetical protein